MSLYCGCPLEILPFAPSAGQRDVAQALAGDVPLDALVDRAVQDECRVALTMRVPEAGHALERMSHAVRSEGLSVLRGVEVGSDHLMVAVSSQLGRVVAQQDRATPERPRLVWDVRPMAPTENVGAYATRGPGALAPHTESPIKEHPERYMVLGCVDNPPSSGGDCALVRVDELLDGLHPSEVALLRDPVFPFMSRQPDLPVRVAAVLRDGDECGTLPRIRYFADGLAAGLAHPGLRPSSAHCAALEHLSSLVHDRAAWTLLDLRPCDVLFFDNQRVLHGRGAITDRRRHLKRLLATV